MPRFHFSSYWQCWSRTLATNDHGIFELNLTPVNGRQQDWDEQVKPERIRVHRTTRSKNDKDVDTLPFLVVERMCAHLGLLLTSRLLHNDYLSQVTIEQIVEANKRHNGGGVPLQNILGGLA